MKKTFILVTLVTELAQTFPLLLRSINYKTN